MFTFDDRQKQILRENCEDNELTQKFLEVLELHTTVYDLELLKRDNVVVISYVDKHSNSKIKISNVFKKDVILSLGINFDLLVGSNTHEIYLVNGKSKADRYNNVKIQHSECIRMIGKLRNNECIEPEEIEKVEHGGNKNKTRKSKKSKRRFRKTTKRTRRR